MKTKKHTKDIESVFPHLHREPGGFQMTWWPSATWGGRTWREAGDAWKEFLEVSTQPFSFHMARRSRGIENKARTMGRQ